MLVQLVGLVEIILSKIIQHHPYKTIWIGAGGHLRKGKEAGSEAAQRKMPRLSLLVLRNLSYSIGRKKRGIHPIARAVVKR